MRGRGWKLLLVCLPMLLGMRDPFQPPRLNCPGGKTGEWRGHQYWRLLRSPDNAVWL
jgi:hypothetical protein